MMSSNDSENWIKAMDKVIENLNENKTWELVEKIPNWKGNKCKMGLQQEIWYDNICALVAKM